MLYKYFSFNENALSCLINNELWVSAPNQFNDPFDSLLTLDFNNSEIQSLFEAYLQKKAVCCFSRNKTNILMWSHYADHHKGFCIGIDWPELEKSELLSEVNYSENFLNLDIDRFLNLGEDCKINKEWERLLTHKYKDWVYEDEVRLILELNDPSNKGKLFPIEEGKIKEIYFGCRMKNNNKETIMKIMKGKDVSFYSMKKSTNSFSLEII